MDHTQKKKYIEAIFEEKVLCLNKKPFTLRRGGASHIYLNNNQFLEKFKNVELLVRLYLQRIPRDVTDFKLGAVDSIMSPILCGMMAAKNKKDIVVIKEQQLNHGLKNQIFGNPKGEIILVDDVTTTGTILVAAAKALRKQGATVRYAMLSACRDDKPIKILQNSGISALYIATYEEIIQTLWPKLTQAEKKAVRMEVSENKYHWSFVKEQ